MFCSKCGQPIGEGKAFCKECGAPAPTEIIAGSPPSPPSSTPPPPPGGAVAPSPPSSPQPLSPPPPGYGPAWQPPQKPPGGQGRTGLVIGIVAAVVVVLAGAGVGTYLLVRGDDTAKTATTLLGSSITTVAPTTTTGPSNGETVIGTSTTQTIPGSTTGSTGGSGSTVTNGSSRDDYLRASDDLVQLLLDDDARIVELATQINNTAPKVPQRVWNELDSMLGELDAAFTRLGGVPVPPEFGESDGWLVEATHAMGERIYATINGIEAMWNANQVSAATPYFDRGRAARDEYRAAFQKFLNTVPID